MFLWFPLYLWNLITSIRNALVVTFVLISLGHNVPSRLFISRNVSKIIIFFFFIFPDLSSFILQTHWVQIFGILFTAFLLSNPLKWLVYFHFIVCTSFSILSSTYPVEFATASVLCAASNMPFITSNSWIFLFHVFLCCANGYLISFSLTAPSLISVSALSSCFIEAISPCLLF